MQSDRAFQVPDHFNRNAPDVQLLGAPADTGKQLLEYMAARLGVGSLEGLDILDYGCGSRFTDAIINRNIPIGSYHGVDVHKEMINYLRDNVRDSRFTFAHTDSVNQLYNPGGEGSGELSLDRNFDVICMFSVITHQNPKEAASTFRLLRKWIRPTGHLFFSTAIDDEVLDFKEQFPEQPGLLCVYPLHAMERMLAESGWRIDSFVPRNPMQLPILASLLCSPS